MSYLVFFLLHLVSYALLFFVFNIKSLLLIVFLYGLGLYIYFKGDLKKTLLFLIIFTLFIEKGLRGWNFWVVSAGPEWWMPGYNFYFGVTLKFIFSLAYLFISFFSPNKQLSSSSKKSHKLLLIFLLLSSISTIFSSDLFLSSLGLMRLFSGAILFFAAFEIFSKKQDRILLVLALSTQFLFLGGIGSLQFLTKQPLGLFLEDSIAFRKHGYLTTDGEVFLYRVAGIFGHPTFFASYLSMLLPVSLVAFLNAHVFKKYSKMAKIIFSLAFFSGLLAILGTFSRSSWLSLVLIFLIAFLILKKAILKIKISKKTLKLFLSSVLIILLLFSPIILSRVTSFKNIWSLGSGRIRLDLASESGKVILNSPLFGSGLNLFTRAMSSNLLPPEIAGFMYPVHNTFLLFFSELGIIPGLLFFVFVFIILKQSFFKAKKDVLILGFWLGAIAFVFNAQFHTLFNQDPSFELMMLYLGLLSGFVMVKKSVKNK